MSSTRQVLNQFLELRSFSEPLHSVLLGATPGTVSLPPRSKVPKFMNAVDPPRSSATNSGEGRDVRSKGPLHARSTATKRPASRRSASRRRRWGRRVLLTVVAAAVLLAGGAIADYYYLGSLIHRTTVHHLQKTTSTENILLVGSTDRCALKVQNKAYGLCSQGVTGINGDIVMVLHLNLTTHAVSLISLPRDTFVPNARTTGANKIDAALYQGPSQLAVAIEEDFAIPISHYVELNFDTFASVVNVLGGINMYFPMEIFDAYSQLNIRHTGCLHLDGFHALQVVRARHLQIRYKGLSQIHSTWPQEGLSDLARIRRDHEFLKVLASALKARGLSNPITDQRLATAVAPYLTVDSSFSTGHMLSLAEKFSSVSIGNVPELTMPVVLVQTGSYLYQGYYYGEVEFPLQPGISSVVHQFLGLNSSTNTLDGRPLPRANAVTVSVVNGTGVTNQAASVAAQLGAHGFRMSAESTAVPFGPRSETVVYHANNSPASIGAAQAVLRDIEGPAVMALGPTTGSSEVTVRTGSDILIAPVHRASTSTTRSKHPSSKSTTTTTVVDPSSVKSDPSLSAPTAVTQALQPWDPRSCGPNNTPGP